MSTIVPPTPDAQDEARPIHFGYLPECPDGVDCTRPGCLDAHMWRCGHQWLDRPESDTRECLICGTEVAG